MLAKPYDPSRYSDTPTRARRRGRQKVVATVAEGATRSALGEPERESFLYHQRLEVPAPSSALTEEAVNRRNDALLETKRYWKARWEDDGQFMRGSWNHQENVSDHKSARLLDFETWWEEKLQQLVERKTEAQERAELKRLEEEKKKEESAKVVRQWENKLRQREREVRKRRAKDRKCKKKEDEKQKKMKEAALRKYEDDLRQRREKKLHEEREQICRKQQELEKQKMIKEEKQALNKEAFQDWLSEKKAQKAHERRLQKEKDDLVHRLEEERRRKRWAKKDVVLAYTNRLPL